MDRRSYLASGLLVALAGCTELGSTDEADAEDDPGEADDDDDDHESNGDDTDSETSELTGTFDDFEDLSEWEAFQDIGSIEADTDRSYSGSQSAHLEPDDDGQVRVRRSLDEPIDVSDVVPGIAMTAEDRSVVRIQLQDEDGDYIEYSQQVLGDMPLARKNFGVTRIRGDPDLSEIIVLQVICWFGDDSDGELWVDDFHFVPDTDSGKVMLQFDGGYETHYTEALPLLEEYDLTGTTFVPTDRIRTDVAVEGDRLTRDQVGELADAGWTIGSQSASGSQLSDTESYGDDLESNITDPIDWLEDEGYDDGARFFAFPGSTYTEQPYELVQENYDLAFAGNAPAQGYAGNPHLCSLATSPDPGEATELLDWTAEWGGITSIAFYEIDDESVLTALEETVSYLSELEEAGDIEVITPAEMADNYVYSE